MNIAIFLAVFFVVWQQADGATASELRASLAAPSGPSQDLAFSEALKVISGASTDVRKADEALAAARERRLQSDYIYYPDVNATGREAGSGTDKGALTTETTAAINATVNVYRFGADRAHRDSIRALADSSEQGRLAVQQASELTAAVALFNVIELSKERDIARAVLSANREMLNLTSKLYNQGQKPEQEIEKVSIDTATVEVRLVDAELALAQAKADLESLAGVPVSVRAEWPWAHLFTHSSQEFQTPDLAALPERRALAAKVEQLGASVREYDAKRLPSIDFVTGYDVTTITERDPNLGYNVSDLHEKKWSAAVTLTIPLFDRLAARTDYEDQGHQKALAELDVVNKDRELRSTLNEVRVGFAAALASARRRDATSAQALKLYERSLKNFRAGLLSANELSLDQSRLLDTELNVERGWASVHKYFARFCHVLGRPLGQCAEELYGAALRREKRQRAAKVDSGAAGRRSF